MSDQMDPDQCVVNKDLSLTEPEPSDASLETAQGPSQKRFGSGVDSAHIGVYRGCSQVRARTVSREVLGS